MSANSRNDIWIKFVFIFFLSLLSFSVGIFVGSKFKENQLAMHKGGAGEVAHEGASHGTEAATGGSHEEHSSAASDAQGAGHNDSTAANESEDHEGGAKKTSAATEAEMPLTDEEVAQFAKEFVTDSTEPTKEVKREPASAEVHAKNKVSVVAVPAHVEPVTEKKQEPTASVNTKTRSVAAVKPETSNTPKETSEEIAKKFASLSQDKYALQIASYQKKEEAEAKIKELQSKGLTAQIQDADVKGVTWHRVMVGPYYSKEEAMGSVSQVKGKAQISHEPILQKLAH